MGCMRAWRARSVPDAKRLDHARPGAKKLDTLEEDSGHALPAADDHGAGPRADVVLEDHARAQLAHGDGAGHVVLGRRIVRERGGELPVVAAAELAERLGERHAAGE